MMKPETKMFNPPNALILDEDIHASYKKFKQKFEIYMKATNYHIEKDERKIAILLNVGGDVAIDVFNSLELNEEQKKNYQNVITAFDNFFMPKENELKSRYHFNTRKQLEGETLKDFIRVLRNLAENCNFGDQKYLLIRDQIIVGMLNDQLRNNLLALRCLTLEQTEHQCYASELAEIHLKKEASEKPKVIKKEDIVNGPGFSLEKPIKIECTPELMETNRQEPVQLPEGLPPNVLELISVFKTAAENYKGDGKKAFFSEGVNLCLLRLWDETTLLSKSVESKIYQYLSQYSNCSKDTLIRRSKNLVQARETKKLETLRKELKNTVDRLMPELMIKYQHKCDELLKQKFGKDKEDGKTKVLKAPRRMYHWTAQSRNLIIDIWNTKKQCLVLEGKHKDLDELVNSYIRTDILPLWPEGWIYFNTIKNIICKNSAENTSVLNSNNTTEIENMDESMMENGK